MSVTDPMDGTESEFPQREFAKARYRRAWMQYQALAHGRFWVEGHEGERLRKEMDDAQLLIARGPGRLWQCFVDTLPGYRVAWRQAVPELIEDLQE